MITITSIKSDSLGYDKLMGRAVARIFQWGGQLASEASKLRTRREAPSLGGGPGAEPLAGG